MSNTWYELINGENLEQGDILKGVEVIKPTLKFLNGETNKVDTEINDVIILTQSCDLANKKTPWVQVTPVVSLSVMKSKFQQFKDVKALESIRRGYQPKYHMINECTLESFEHEVSILDFRNVYTLPFDYVLDKAKQEGNRVRLTSPYKEHMSQAYAKFFMRVGLPNDIQPFG